MLTWRSLGNDLADLVLARACAGCERPGGVLCAACWAHLTTGIIERELPDGGAARAGTDYLGVGKSVVIAHKEHGWQALTPFLGAVLARAITSLTSEPVTLVPIPPHAHALTRRGTDPLADTVQAAVRALRAVGHPAGHASLLRRTRDSASSKRLNRADRRRAVELSFALAARPRQECGAVVIVDDVITTGITIAEARQALECAGIRVHGAAAVASTPLRGGRH